MPYIALLWQWKVRIRTGRSQALYEESDRFLLQWDQRGKQHCRWSSSLLFMGIYTLLMQKFQSGLQHVKKRSKIYNQDNMPLIFLSPTEDLPFSASHL